MDFELGVRRRLVTDPAVSAIIAARVYPLERPQNSKGPAITYQVISDPRSDHLKGPDGARPTRVQLDCWADTYAVAKALVRAAIAALRFPATVQGKRFGHARVEGPRDLRETVAGGKTIHRQSVDLIIWHVGD